MPWNEKIKKEGYGRVKLYTLEEAQAYARKHDIPIVREKEWDRQANSLQEQLRGAGKIEVVSLDGTKTYTFRAIPVDIRPLGPETPGVCFDDEQRKALVRVAEVGAAESDRQRAQWDVGRGAVTSDEIKAIRTDCGKELEVWLTAIEGFAEKIGAKTNTSKTAGVRNARAGLTKNGAHGWHFDGGLSSIRVVSVRGGGFLECCITAVSESDEPMILGAHGAPNPIDEVGCLCAGRLCLADEEDYCLTKTGSGFSKLFFMERKLPDGSVKYGRAHAVPAPTETRIIGVTTFGKTEASQEDLVKSLPQFFAPAVNVSEPGAGWANCCRGGSSCSDHAPAPVPWHQYDCVDCQKLANDGAARAPPKRARLALEGNIQHRGTDTTHISCARYAKPGSAVPERCSEHRRDGDVLIVDVCGHEDCTKSVAFTRSADATCDGAHGYCTEHGRDRKGYHRSVSTRCYGGDGECSKEAAHHRVEDAVGAGAARLCPEHFAGLGGAAQKQYARSDSKRCYGGDGTCKDRALHSRVAGADGAGAAALCPKHLAALGEAAQKQYARSSMSCDNCSSGQRGYVRRDGKDGELCPACHDALDAATRRKDWWRVPWERCGDTCGAAAKCPRLADAPLTLPERLCAAHVKELPPDARIFYTPPSSKKSKKKMCDLCGDNQAVFFGEGREPKMRCAKHALDGPAKNKRKRESCVGLKRVQSKRCGGGTCYADGSQGVQRIGNSTSRLCVGCGTVGKRGNKQPIEGYEFVDKKKRDAAAERAAPRL